MKNRKTIVKPEIVIIMLTVVIDFEIKRNTSIGLVEISLLI